jgi:ectoine hydroxylase-related dioxygenase (phytanoyl-CoA dioxygenase family)
LTDPRSLAVRCGDRIGQSFSEKELSMDYRSAAREFHERGFLVIPNALSREQLSLLHRAVDRDLDQHGPEWVKFDESYMETPDALSRSDAFDFTIENPVTLPLLRALLGELITLEEFEIIIRNPTAKTRDIKAWHRDATRDYERRMEIEYVSLVYYLTDVSETDHCLSIVPGSHYRLVDLKPSEVPLDSEIDMIGPAGTGIIFHGRCIHAGKLKPGSRQRRTLHIYFARSDQPRYSEWTEIPPRLYQKVDDSLPPLLYSKWNVNKVFEGVGKKPRDLPQSMPVPEMLLEVQRRANPVA